MAIVKREKTETSLAEQVREAPSIKRAVFNKVKPILLIPTGSTVLNLTCSGNPFGGYSTGTMVNVIGDSSSGKCVKNSYILSENGMEYIDDIGKEFDYGFSPYKKTLVVDKNKKDTTAYFYKDKVNKTIKITTSKGYSIEGTPEHKIMVFTPNREFLMVPLKNILKGDFTIIVPGTNSFQSKYIPTNTLSSFKALDSVYMKDSSKFPIIMDEDFAKLLGYIVADGSITKNFIQISNSKEYFKKEISKIVNGYGLSLSKKGVFHSKKFVNIVRELIDNVDKFTARYKFVPDIILKSPKTVQVAFLQSLISCDGWSDNQSIEYYSASEKLANQVHLMLLNLGIVSSLLGVEGAFDGKKYHGHTYYTIRICGMNINKFINDIGSIKWKFKLRKAEKTNSEHFPFLKEKMVEDVKYAREQTGWSCNGKMFKRKGRFPRLLFNVIKNVTEHALVKFINTFNGMSDLIDIPYYKKFLCDGYLFDQVVCIKEFDTIEEVDVYDVNIPNNHLFWCNGFISHNSLQALTMFAEVCERKEFDDYLLYYDDAESALKFDIVTMFGKKLAKRIDTSIKSKNAETFYGNFLKLLEKGKKFLYVMDSWDSLRTIEEEDRMQEFIKLVDKDKEIKGTYGQSKPRLASEIFRVTCGELENTESFLYIISQVRANLKAAMFGNPTIRSGGYALKFYATHEIWLSVKKHLENNERTYGINALVKVKKNKLNGREDKLEFPIYYSYGIDDIGSCIDFLVNENFWKRAKGILTTDATFPLEAPMPQEEFITMVEENPEMMQKLKMSVYDAFLQIDEELKVKRKKKYA